MSPADHDLSEREWCELETLYGLTRAEIEAAIAEQHRELDELYALPRAEFEAALAKRFQGQHKRDENKLRLIEQARREAPALRQPSDVDREGVNLELSEAGWDAPADLDTCRHRVNELLRDARQNPWWPHVEARVGLQAGLYTGKPSALRRFMYITRGLDPGDQESALYALPASQPDVTLAPLPATLTGRSAVYAQSWRDGLTAREISTQFGVQPESIEKRIVALRRQYGPEVIPLHRSPQSPR